ncbi:Protein of unknown function [Paraburkholderia steynii]|uniref:DUF1064 domain-containing protein n=1 Tax=Paraburkholderia steynii TaxID=1245441 RepID=A0A7Z7BBY2_9BURK|nr:DUF1064 domain-containing protein [Paraburkholderia steynii]SDI64969.1 Protein of unknown function [Paraburkholderia steynii]
MSKNALRYPESAITAGRFGTARVHGNPIAMAAREIAAVTSEPAARSKYGNVPTVVNGITFDSAREAARYEVLARLQLAGQISELQIQVPFDVVPAAVVAGKSRRPVRYIADFVYRDAGGARVVEDVKGMLTAIYKLKRHLMKVVHGIDIVEVK